MGSLLGAELNVTLFEQFVYDDELSSGIADQLLTRT